MEPDFDLASKSKLDISLVGKVGYLMRFKMIFPKPLSRFPLPLSTITPSTIFSGGGGSPVGLSQCQEGRSSTVTGVGIGEGKGLGISQTVLVNGYSPTTSYYPLYLATKFLGLQRVRHYPRLWPVRVLNHVFSN